MFDFYNKYVFDSKRISLNVLVMQLVKKKS